ncbi:MAG: glycosyltransferase family 2 protein, partial [Thermoflavifilum sp.]|nr:glycosyltransferase family 2 protein [Thermoflavifilum sp.]
MNQPLVSVLMPSYNKAPYIGEAIESVLCQTYRNLELIVVDDASTDGSWEVIQAYQKRFPYTIKAVQQPHSGGCAARNKAFALSSGKYIQYLDADDILDPEKIAAQMNVFTGTGEEDYVANGKLARFYTSDYRKENLFWQPSLPAWEDITNDEWLKLGWISHITCWLTPRRLIVLAGGWDEELP